MDFSIASGLEKELKKIKFRNNKLFIRIGKQLLLFQRDHMHPSLRPHKLTGKTKNIWSISIDSNIRMLYILDEKGACFFDIGTHDEVYRR